MSQSRFAQSFHCMFDLSISIFLKVIFISKHPPTFWTSDSYFELNVFRFTCLSCWDVIDYRIHQLSHGVLSLDRASEVWPFCDPAVYRLNLSHWFPVKAAQERACWANSVDSVTWVQTSSKHSGLLEVSWPTTGLLELELGADVAAVSCCWFPTNQILAYLQLCKW